MKKIIFTLVIGVIGFAAMAQNDFGAQKIKRQPNIPVEVKNAYDKDFPNTNAEWEMEAGNYEANFKTDGIASSAVYNPQGHRMETEIGIHADKLPASAYEYIQKNYPDHQLKVSSMITDDKNKVTYECEIAKNGKKTEVMFDAAGKFVKTEHQKAD